MPDSKNTMNQVELSAKITALKEELTRSIVGQKDVINSVITTLLCGGHALLTGVPGLAKTRLISSLAEALSITFSRIQFTPDLMPMDITGTDIVAEDPVTRRRGLEFLKGPVFANLILADEINRTPPKTQSAMLQIMQEREVTVGNNTYALPKPFSVFATQNPLDQEGTYALPEAQSDRFMFNIVVKYPSIDEEVKVVRQTTVALEKPLNSVLDGDTIIKMQDLVRAMPVSDELIRYAVRLASATRPEDPGSPPMIREYVHCGASPRASQYMILAAKAAAVMNNEVCAQASGVWTAAHEVLRHRLVLNFKAKSRRICPDDLIDPVLSTVPENES